MDSDSRIKVRKARDAATRRTLGFRAAPHGVRHQPASKSRRWTDQEIEAAVTRVGGGKKISRHAYKIARRKLDPSLAPKDDTVFARRPDLFSN